MKALSCDEAALLLDLYAAGECGPADDRAVRAHLDACPACRHSAEEARQLLGLLDVHFRQDAALEKLSHALRAEQRPARRPVILSFARRFAAVAALVLLT